MLLVRALRGVWNRPSKRDYRHKENLTPKLYKGLYPTNKLDPNMTIEEFKNQQVYFASKGL